MGEVVLRHVTLNHLCGPFVVGFSTRVLATEVCCCPFSKTRISVFRTPVSTSYNCFKDIRQCFCFVIVYGRGKHDRYANKDGARGSPDWSQGLGLATATAWNVFISRNPVLRSSADNRLRAVDDSAFPGDTLYWQTNHRFIEKKKKKRSSCLYESAVASCSPGTF